MSRLSRKAIVSSLAMATLALAPVGAFADDHLTPFHQDVLANFDRTSKQLVALANAIPEDMFGWRPNNKVRTVSEVYIHTVGTNMLLPAALGATPPEGVDMSNPFGLMQEWESTITSKADVIAKLEESIAYAKEAIGSIQDLETEVTLFGPPQSKRAFLLIILTHAHEHLGQSIAYARTIGIAPPWSQGGDN